MDRLRPLRSVFLGFSMAALIAGGACSGSPASEPSSSAPASPASAPVEAASDRMEGRAALVVDLPPRCDECDYLLELLRANAPDEVPIHVETDADALSVTAVDRDGDVVGAWAGDAVTTPSTERAVSDNVPAMVQAGCTVLLIECATPDVGDRPLTWGEWDLRFSTEDGSPLPLGAIASTDGHILISGVLIDWGAFTNESRDDCRAGPEPTADEPCYFHYYVDLLVGHRDDEPLVARFVVAHGGVQRGSAYRYVDLTSPDYDMARVMVREAETTATDTAGPLPIGSAGQWLWQPRSIAYVVERLVPGRQYVFEAHPPEAPFEDAPDNRLVLELLEGGVARPASIADAPAGTLGYYRWRRYEHSATSLSGVSLIGVPASYQESLTPIVLGIVDPLMGWWDLGPERGEEDPIPKPVSLAFAESTQRPTVDPSDDGSDWQETQEPVPLYVASACEVTVIEGGVQDNLVHFSGEIRNIASGRHAGNHRYELTAIAFGDTFTETASGNLERDSATQTATFDLDPHESGEFDFQLRLPEPPDMTSLFTARLQTAVDGSAPGGCGVGDSPTRRSPGVSVGHDDLQVHLGQG